MRLVISDKLSLVVTALFPISLLIYAATIYLIDFGMFYAAILTGVVGLVVLVLILYKCISRITKYSAISLIMVIVTWLIWLFVPVRDFGAFVRFQIDRDQYEAVVKNLTVGKEIGCLKSEMCEVDKGPPLRVAFTWGGIGNWLGIIYNPSDDFEKNPQNIKAFGREGGSCKKMGDHYYLCGFD